MSKTAFQVPSSVSFEKVSFSDKVYRCVISTSSHSWAELHTNGTSPIGKFFDGHFFHTVDCTQFFFLLNLPCRENEMLQQKSLIVVSTAVDAVLSLLCVACDR